VLQDTPRAANPRAPSESAVLEQAGHENFPVASRLLPADVRTDLLAIYGFARLVDDIGDEVEGDRLELLDWLDEELERSREGEATHPLMQRLTPTIRRHSLSLEPFRALIAANRQDQIVTSYETLDDLIEYCMLSAAPVGQLVLAVFGAATPERVALSDNVCNGLQVVEHLQDIAEDAAQGRVYLPREVMERHGCKREDVFAARATPALARAVAEAGAFARKLLRSGAPLSKSLTLRPRAAVAGFTAGGLAALDEIERVGFDTLANRCRPRKSRLARNWIGVLAGRAGQVS